MSRPLQRRGRALPNKTQAAHLHSCITRPVSWAERAIPDAFDSINLCVMVLTHWSVQLMPLATSRRRRASRPSAAERKPNKSLIGSAEMRNEDTARVGARKKEHCFAVETGEITGAAGNLCSGGNDGLWCMNAVVIKRKTSTSNCRNRVKRCRCE
jgi:hypothetical protein